MPSIGRRLTRVSVGLAVSSIAETPGGHLLSGVSVIELGCQGYLNPRARRRTWRSLAAVSSAWVFFVGRLSSSLRSVIRSSFVVDVP